MHLILSRDTPTNTVLSSEEGQALYKVETPFKPVGETYTIGKAVPNNIGGADDHGMQTQFAHLAQIEWRALGQSKSRYVEGEVDIKTYFRNEGFGWYGRHRVYSAGRTELQMELWYECSGAHFK